MTVKLLTEHHLEFLSLKGGCRGSSESTLVKIPHCWKSHVTAQLYFTYIILIYLLHWSTIDDGGLLIIEHLTEPFKDCISYLRCDYPSLERTITRLLTYFIMNYNHHLTARTDYVLETANASPGSNLAYLRIPQDNFSWVPNCSLGSS